MSTFECLVVPVTLEPHPNADKLSIVRVGGYRVVVKTDDWKDCDRGVYIPPDSVVPDHPRWAFLGEREKDRRITVRRFRGIYSEGLLMPIAADALIGSDKAADWGIAHYEPAPTGGNTYSDAEAPPFGVRPVYDLENLQKFGHNLRDGTEVVITEKLHGTNARYCWQNGRMYAGSRKEWKSEGGNVWWQALRQYPGIEKLCRAHPDLTLYGEIYGDVQDLKYGHQKGAISFAAFDLYRGGDPPRAGVVVRLMDAVVLRLGYQRIVRATGFLDLYTATRMCSEYGVPWVPTFWMGAYTEEWARGFMSGPSLVEGADNIREGCVVRPVVEQSDNRGNRIHYKLVSPEYLERRA